MNKTDVVRQIGEVLSSIQLMSGREPAEVSESTRPIGDLSDFDSLNGVEASVELSTKFGIEVPGVNVFVTENGAGARTVGEIADIICAATRGQDHVA